MRVSALGIKEINGVWFGYFLIKLIKTLTLALGLVVLKTWTSSAMITTSFPLYLGSEEILARIWSVFWVCFFMGEYYIIGGMGNFGDFYNKNKKKLSKEEQVRKAAKSGTAGWVVPQPQVIKRGKKENW